MTDCCCCAQLLLQLLLLTTANTALSHAQMLAAAAVMDVACNGHCYHAVSQNCALWGIAQSTKVIVQELLSCRKGLTAGSSCFVSFLELKSCHQKDLAASLWFVGIVENGHTLCERLNQCVVQSFWRARSRCTPLRSSSKIDWDSRLCNKGTWFRPVLFYEWRGKGVEC